MIKIGQYNNLKINRMVDFGAYLDCGDDTEVLIPAKFLESDAAPGDYIEVFVYTDSEDRLIATTEHPFATVGEFAFMQVADVNNVGAFLDWGLEAKQLLVPHSEQKSAMRQGGIYLVYVYLDNTTRRVVASAKTDKFLGNVIPRYKKGDKVKALVVKHTPIGYACIVDNLHHGMIYDNLIFSPIVIEEEIDAYVNTVRADGKIDLILSDRSDRRTASIADKIMDKLHAEGRHLNICDKSSPELIKETFGCSKKDFKKAVGLLYKQRKITLSDSGISLL